MQNKRKNLLEGSIKKSILLIAIPIIFSNILQTVYQLIDTFWVGRLGTEAVAAVSLSFPIIFLLQSLAMGFAMAGSILVSQYNGKGDKDKVSLVTGQTLGFILILAPLISIVGILITKYTVGLLTSDPLVFQEAVNYLQISFLCILSIFIFMVFQSVLRGIGEVRLPMIIISITVVLNFFLDPIFMMGWGPVPAMGVTGVALATLITESLSALIGLIILFSGRHEIRLHWRDLMVKKIWVKKLAKIGLPSSLEMSSRSLGMVIMILLVSTFGTLVVATYGIGTRILSFVIIPAMGFAMSTSTLVGNNLGAKQKERTLEIVQTGIRIAFMTLTVAGLLIFIFAPQIAGFLVPNETELIKMSSLFIRIMALGFGFIGIQMVINGALRAAGKTSISMFLAMTHTAIIFILAFTLSTTFKMEALGLWIAYPIAMTLSLFLALAFYKKKNWLHKNLIDQ
jgi:putative MATE family efflux protein